MSKIPTALSSGVERGLVLLSGIVLPLIDYGQDSGPQVLDTPWGPFSLGTGSVLEARRRGSQ